MLRRGALLVVLAALLLGHAHAQTNSSSTQPEETNCGVGNKSECMSECTAPAAALAVPEEVVLVLGNSGSGKSTLAKFLSKQDGDMVAVQENNDYLILGDGIGSSIESVTTVPELFRDNETGTSYFDCPGFEDTRGPCSEVTTTYFMKDIARHARRVKVLLLAPHFAVRKGQDRGDFLTMLKHAAAMLKSPSKMAHSLALVVSKVDAPFVKVRGRYSKVPDREVARGVAAFLSKDVRPYLAAMAEDAGVDQEEKAVLANAVKIVDVLLTESKGDYDRIGLFHAPDEEGVLDDIQIMRDGRQALTGLVHERLRYADVQPADFGFSVSARTRVFALDRARRLSTEFLAVLEEQSKSSKNQTAHAYEPIGDVRARQERYEELLQASAATSESLANSTSVEEFCERLDDHQKLGDMCGLLKVLQVVSDQPLVDQAVVTRTWTAPQQSFARWVDEKKQWNDFLLSTYQRCNSYTVQVKRRSWLRADEALSEILELSSAKTRVLQFNATGQNMSDLSALVSLVSRGPKATCLPDGVVVVEGESVLLSEALTLARGRCPGAPQLLEVHALNTFFIDDSVSLRGAALAVAAPRWEILGSPSINLDGEDGAPLGRVPWRVGSGGGERGQDGQQGNPGHPGGKFLGLGLEFIGGKVVVSVKGGAGGAGQDGGAGGNGRSGGGNGGNGGNGGAGGVGGQRGKAVVQPLGLGYVDVNDYFKLVEASGAPGSGGRGGLGGDFRPHTALRRKKRFVITSIVLGVLGAAAAGAGVYYATKPRQPEPAPYVPPRYEPPRYIPTYHSGARGQDGTMPWGQVAGGRSKWEQNRDFDRVWDSLSDRMKTYVELNRNHPYLKKELQSFLHVLQEDEDRRTDIYHDPYDYK